MEILRAANALTMPWRNGGGSTTEIAAGPPGASLDNFDWRVSMARVATDGPFSHFAGVDRTLAVVTGRGLMLQIDNRPQVTLAAGSEPVSFPGDAPTHAQLTRGEITDLNVMTRRGRFRHSLQRIVQPASRDLAGDAGIAIVVSLHGRTTASTDRASDILDHGDAAIVRRANESKIRIEPGATAICYLVLLSEVQTA
jgi:uncharacterized protein